MKKKGCVYVCESSCVCECVCVCVCVRVCERERKSVNEINITTGDNIPTKIKTHFVNFFQFFKQFYTVQKLDQMAERVFRD